MRGELTEVRRSLDIHQNSILLWQKKQKLSREESYKNKGKSASSKAVPSFATSQQMQTFWENGEYRAQKL